MLIVLRNAFQSMVCFPTKRTSSVLSRFSLWYQLPQLYPGRHPAERAKHTVHGGVAMHLSQLSIH